MDDPPRFRFPLQALLALLVLAALLPIAGVVSWQVHDSLQAGRMRTEEELHGAASALAQSVDRELASSIGALKVLSQSELFQQGRVAAMGRLLHGRPRRDWDSIFLLDAQGNVVLDTAPRASPAQAFRVLHQSTMGKLEPVVAALGDNGFAIALPVMEQDRARYVLGVRLANSLWARLAANTALPEGAHARLYDAGGRLISQSGGAAPAGARIPAEALQPMLRKAFGVQRSTEADGGAVYAAWDRVPLAGWHARVYVPAGPIDDARQQVVLDALKTYGLALLAGLLLAAAMAEWVLRRVRSDAARPRGWEEWIALAKPVSHVPRRNRRAGHPPRG